MAAHGGAEMFELMAKNTCMLVLDWVPGGPLLAGDKDGPFQPARLLQTASDLGRRAGQFVYEKRYTREISYVCRSYQNVLTYTTDTSDAPFEQLAMPLPASPPAADSVRHGQARHKRPIPRSPTVHFQPAQLFRPGQAQRRCICSTSLTLYCPINQLVEEASAL